MYIKEKKKKQSKNLLNIFFGIVFLSAAVYRILNPQAGINELNEFNIHGFFIYFVIAFELFVGTLFLLEKKLKLASLLTILFLSIAIIISILINFSDILKNIGELFVFDSTPTDILLHLIYLSLIIYIYKRESKH